MSLRMTVSVSLTMCSVEQCINDLLSHEWTYDSASLRMCSVEQCVEVGQ